MTRDYLLELEQDGAPLLSVWGGKITTFRKLAEEAADRLVGVLGVAGRPWTAGARLPGGELSRWITPSGRPDTDIARFRAALPGRLPQVPERVLARWARSYGALVERIVARGDLGTEVAPDLFEAELHYLREHEWARCADDVLWRRTKLGLHLSADERRAVEDWWREHPWPLADQAAVRAEVRAWN